MTSAVHVIDLPENPLIRAPLAEGSHENNFAKATDTIAKVAEVHTPRQWYLMFGLAVAGFMILVGCLTLVVASPALIRVRARTARQMRLANALCRLVEVAT